MKIAEPPRVLHALVGTIAFSDDEGELGGVVIASDHVANVPRLTLCDAFMRGFQFFDPFCAELFGCVEAVASGRLLECPAMVFADETLTEQAERYSRLPLFMTTSVASVTPADMTVVVAYPDYIEQDPRVRARSVTAYRVSGLLWVSPGMAAKLYQHPFDALRRHRFGPGGAVLPDALSFAIEVLREPGPRSKRRAKINSNNAR